ncbi:hypothetical protein ABKV19_006849 [Rosa sericea]
MCLDFVSNDTCHKCIDAAQSNIMNLCPKSKEAIVWEEWCQLRYSNENFFGILDVSDNVVQINKQNISEPEKFKSVVNQKLSELAEKVAYNDSFTKMYATGEVNFGDEVIYALVQCTTDLSGRDCHTCLQRATEDVLREYFFAIGARLFSRSCFLRYELYSFYDDATQASKGKSKLSSIVIPSILAPVALCVLVVVVARCFIRKLKRAKRQQNEGNIKGTDMTTVESLQFDLGTVEAATKKISADNMLGEGGFGQVFKGILDNGQEIAVKRLSKSSGQGVREFKNEVFLVAKLQHRNLVKLLGFCLEGEETLLVYEYVPNKSLDYFLFEAKKREQLDWSRRCTIIGGIARGILYLHEDSRLRVIHRDLKASNILLDASMNPKISDFGMARMFGVDDQTQGSTRRIVGT